LALLLSFVASIYPAWRATRILPAEVLRYEWK
jgi:lipoprotein-releasing system permease protein